MQIMKKTLRVPAGPNRVQKHEVTLTVARGRIEFTESPFALKDEIKAMAGSRWHGRDKPPRKVWSVKDCPRNWFQIEYLEKGDEVYQWFDRPLTRHSYPDIPGVKIMPHQYDMADHALTYHYGVIAGEPGVGKTLAAQLVMEHNPAVDWWWVGPAGSLRNIERELRKFYCPVFPRFLSYHGLVKEMREDGHCPRGVIFDESHLLANATSQRSEAAQELANAIRASFGFKGFVIEMSGTPAPKSPVAWWSQAEIAWPGFLREGSSKALEQRLGVFEEREFDAGVFNARVDWNEEEVAYMYERLKGLVCIKLAKNCIDLPELIFRRVELEPSKSLLRAAKIIADTAPSAIQAATWLRELSDGFKYQEVVTDDTIECDHCEGGIVTDYAPDSLPYDKPCPLCNGTQRRPKVTREARKIDCPKEEALRGILADHEGTGRLVVFAAFQASVDRAAAVCRKEGWHVIRVDGRGWQVTDCDGRTIAVKEPLDYWEDWGGRCAFVANQESGGMSFTLTAARGVVFWSNVFKPEFREQGIKRIHRHGQTKGCQVYDFLHLPSDAHVLETVLGNRRVELLTLGELQDVYAQPA